MGKINSQFDSDLNLIDASIRTDID